MFSFSFLFYLSRCVLVGTHSELYDVFREKKHWVSYIKHSSFMPSPHCCLLVSQCLSLLPLYYCAIIIIIAIVTIIIINIFNETMACRFHNIFILWFIWFYWYFLCIYFIYYLYLITYIVCLLINFCFTYFFSWSLIHQARVNHRCFKSFPEQLSFNPLTSPSLCR